MGEGDDTQLIIGVGVIIFLAVLLGAFAGILTISAAYYALGAGVVGIVLWLLWRKQYLHKLMQTMEQHEPDTLGESRDVGQLWKDLQSWEQQDPRVTELIWDPLNTYIKFTALPTDDDEMFYFYSIITKIADKDEQLHIGIESRTGYIVHHAPVRFMQEIKKDPFEYMPIVNDLRSQRNTSKQVRRHMRSASYGRLPGNYGKLDRSMMPPETGDTSE